MRGGNKGGRGYPPRSGVTAGMTGQAGYGTGGGYGGGGGYVAPTTTMAAGYTTTYVSGAPYADSRNTSAYSSGTTPTYGVSTRSTRSSAYKAATPATQYTSPTKESNGSYSTSTPTPAATPMDTGSSWEKHLKQPQQQETMQPEAEMEVDNKEGATQGKKRKTFQFQKRTKRPKLEPKNPVLLLNELKPGLEYQFSDIEGSQSYKCGIVVNGVTYEGISGSKKDARHKAAESALKGQIEARNTDIYEKLAKRVTFTPPDGEVPDNVDNEQLFKLIETDPQPQAVNAQPKEKHPVMLLNEYAEKVLTYQCIKDEGSVGKQKYTMRVEVNGESFEGSARNLKAAKSQAARLALARLYNIFVPDSDVGSTGMSIVKDTVTLLGEIHKTPLYYEMIENIGGGSVMVGPGGPRVIVMKVTVNGQPFEGRGKTKKQAKARAAQNALAQIYGITAEVPMAQIGVSLFRSPITVLQHYNGPKTAYELAENNDGQKSITASVVVDGETYTGTGRSKYHAKAAAARDCLAKKYNINMPDEENPVPLATPPKQLAKRGGFAGGMMRGGFVGMPGYGPCYPPGFYGGYGFSNYTSFSNYNAPMPPNPMMQPKAAAFPPQTVKPPTTVLMETHKQALTYECTKEEGTNQSKLYTMVVHVNGVPYEGVAKSKREAKFQAARNALEKVYKIKAEGMFVPPAANGTNPAVAAPVPPGMVPPAPRNALHAEMHPVMLLNQLTDTKHEYVCVGEDGPVHDRLYTMQVTSKEQKFTGQARNKKDAKAAAARNALATLFNVQQSAPGVA